MKTARKEAEQTPRRLILPKEFSKECYLVDFEKEYGKDNGIPERWGIATELTSDGLERKYGAFLNPYRPFRIMRWEEGAVIAAFIRNDEKHRKWQIRHDDGLGYSDRTDIKKIRISFLSPAKPFGYLNSSCCQARNYGFG